MTSGYRQIEHTADLALELWAPDEAELLVTAARAVTELLTHGATIERRERVEIALETLDAADRLVQWCNEILYRASVHAFVCADADLQLLPDGLRATLHGEADARHRLQTEIKSATYHDLELVVSADGWRARLVLDV